MTKRTKAFLRGYGSVLTVKSFKKRSHIVSMKLGSDWETIAGDFHKIIQFTTKTKP